MTRITDSNFAIIGPAKDRYHIECESNPDNDELQIRVFQYDMQVALYGREFIDGVMHVNFPKTAILYLRHNSNTSDALKISIHDGDNELTREIPVIKVQQFSLEEIFEKHLLIFLPFHIFLHEKKLSVYNEDKEKRQELIRKYEAIIGKLNDLNQVGELSSLEKYCIITSMRNVLNLMAKNYAKVKKEVDKVMGGELLEYEAKTIYRNGISKGIEKGRLEGKKDGQNDLVNAIERLRNGESREDIIASGIDEHTVSLAEAVR